MDTSLILKRHYKRFFFRNWPVFSLVSASTTPHFFIMHTFFFNRAGAREQKSPNPEVNTGNAVGMIKLVYHKKALVKHNFKA